MPYKQTNIRTEHMALLENMSNTKMMTTMTTAITSKPYKQTNIRTEHIQSNADRQV